MKKIAIIGAGPAGMTAAYQLSKVAGVEVHLYEAENQVGGMAKTISLWNQKVDIGPHRFFSSDLRVNKLWLEVAEGEYSMVDRLTRIYYGKKFYYYPLRALNALINLGIFEATICVLSYFVAKIFPKKDESNFENWVTNRFGKRLYQIFFKTYSEKLWGISCKDLDADFAAQRIKKLSLFEAIKNALLKGKGNKHKTLVDQFAYPLNGTGAIYEKMAKKFVASGGKLFLSVPIKKVIQNKENAVSGIETFDGKVETYDYVISSMPITKLIQNLELAPTEVKSCCNQLKFRNTIIVYLNIARENLFPDQWLYVHSNDLRTGRVTNFRNWVPSLYDNEKTSILCLEYWCYSNDQIWQESDSNLIELAINEIKKTNLIQNSQILAGHVFRIPKCYPVYSSGYKSNLTRVENYLSSINNLLVIGRYGAFKYNNQDHSILMGMLAAENIVENTKKNDLWKINSDYEYQESSKITKTGLQIETFGHEHSSI